MDAYYVPVEQKTSNITKPAFSHVIQVTAYCMIVEDLKGMYPPYGILKYKKHEFKIPYEKRWKNLVLKLRDDLASDRQRNKAHRNHNKVFKCKYCVRREFCPEKLV